MEIGLHKTLLNLVSWKLSNLFSMSYGVYLQGKLLHSYTLMLSTN